MATKKSNKRSRKSRFSNRLLTELLERREMFAVNLMDGVDMAPSVNLAVDTQPVTASGLAGTEGGPVVDPGPGTTTSHLGEQISVNEFADAFFDPAPPPELGATFEQGVLTVTGSHDADHLYIHASEGTVHVREVVKGITLLSVPLEDLRHIVVNANGGDDWVNVDELSISVATTLRGDWGNDTLQGGAGADRLFGGSGNDKLLGRAGDDAIHGDHGDDLLVGGDGNDMLYGGAGNDYLLGGDGNDWLMGEDGNDQMFGEAGNDIMFGGAGQNLMDGGTGDDSIYGGDDIDAIYGGDGHDFIRGFGGDDRIHAEGGNDYILADDGADIVDGGEGDDQISGGNGNDALSGGIGNDVISGGGGQDWLDGDDGRDVLNGGAGNDWLQGGAGVDQLDGGSGDNKNYQNYPDGYVRTGQITQSLSLGGIGDFFVDIAEGIVDVVKWTFDKAEAIANSFYEWASHIDERLVRTVGNMADALSNWPWEADFWKGLGRTLVSALDLAGLAEAWEIASEILKPWQRGMSSEEIQLARGVFGNSIPYELVRIDELSLMAGIGRTHVTGYIINSTESLDDPTLIHELTHVWQYVQDGLVYIPEAIAGQAGDDGYDYGDVAGLRDKMAAGNGLSAFNPEQQGTIVADYFMLRQEARTHEANGATAPLAMRQDLDVYIHFVKEVSTLSAEQLDTPNPVLPTRTDVGDVGQVVQVISSPVRPSSPPDVLPFNSATLHDNVDRAFAQLSPEASTPRATTGMLDLEIESRKLRKSFVRALAVDRVLPSIV
jgi:Ca2+-binding RTX toxin-like protein